MEDATLVGTLVAVIIVLYKVIEFLIGKFNKKNGSTSGRLTSEEAARQARETYEHVVFNVVPELKLMSENQKEIVKNLEKQAIVSEKSIVLLEKLTGVVDAMEQRMKIEEEVQKRLKIHSGKE